MNCVAIIPARGGSKRIPRKNIREFAGKPIIAYSIECAYKSGLFERIIVSTDDEEIARVAIESGAEVPFLRPSELSDDYTGTTKVIAHAVNWLKEHNQCPDIVCSIYPTAPFIQVEDLKKGLNIMNEGKWEYVFSATTFDYPIFRGFQQHPDGSVEMFFPEHFCARSQDLPEGFHDAGQFYFGNTQAWVNELKLFDRWSTIVQIPRWRAQDIDTIEDWERAEFIMKMLSSQNHI
jgi:pseudaminic acid cytidylyltransferase